MANQLTSLSTNGWKIVRAKWRRHCHGFLHVLATLVLSFLAGYADVITYMRYGSFAASMTGNVIFAGRELAKCSWPDVCFYVLIMVSWTTGSCLYIEIEKICPRKGGSWTAIAVALTPCLFFKISLALPRPTD